MDDYPRDGHYSQSQRWNQDSQEMWVALYIVEIHMHTHGPSLKMSNYSAFQPIGMNSQPSHMTILCSDENVKFIRRKAPNYVLTMFKFCEQNKAKCGDQKRSLKSAMKKSYVCSLVQIGFTLGTNALEPNPWVFHGLVQKAKNHEVL
jgi:hypothetical protein